MRLTDDTLLDGDPTVHLLETNQDRTACDGRGHTTSLPEAVTCEDCWKVMEESGDYPNMFVDDYDDADEECPDTERVPVFGEVSDV